MAGATCPDEARLRAVLKSLGAPPAEATEGDRIVSETGGPDALGAILLEIDQTILTRRLTFAGESGSAIVCDVADRRIVRFSADNTIPDQDVTTDDCGAVARQLERFSDAAATVEVRREVTDPAWASDAFGLSVVDLARHLRPGVMSDVEQVPVETALAESESYALAILDNGAAQGSDLKGQAQIGTQLRALEFQFGAQLDAGAQDQPLCQTWLGGSADPYALLLVCLPARRIWMAFEPAHLEACVACWSRVG